MIAIEPTFEKYELARLLGSSKSCRVSHAVDIKIDRLQPIFKDLLEPSLRYCVKHISLIKKKHVHIQGGPVLTSLKLSRTLKNCEEVICFIATIGNGIDDAIARLMAANRFSDAYILDSMGSVAVENMVESFWDRMRNDCEADGKEATLRFSPGYCDWPVTEQKKLFSLFDSADTGVELTDSCLMQPRKSISGVFGVAPFGHGVPAAPYNPCSECWKRDCSARRKET